MKAAAVRALRGKMRENAPVFGLWVTLESASITEIAVALGMDFVVVDAEHGHLDWREVLDHTRAAARSNTVVLTRLAELNGALIKRALDIGVDGVVIPMVESTEQLTQAVAWCKYPPKGKRGIGGERSTAWGRALSDAIAVADSNVMVVPLIETVTGARRIHELCQVAEVDLFWFGPADFAASAGFAGQWDVPGVTDRLLEAKDIVTSHGKACGIQATGVQDLLSRKAQGFLALSLGSDASLLLRSLTECLSVVGRNTRLTPDLVPPEQSAD